MTIDLRHLALVCCCAAALLAAATVLGQSPPEWLLGDWVLNSEKTHELTPKQSGGGMGGGFGTPTISVGGVGIPLPGASSAPAPGGAQDPRVLRCDAMSVSMDGANVRFEYRGVGEETMKPGDDQGRKTRWGNGELTQRYITTVRTVTKTYQLEDDGSLVVRVKINPKGAKSATHVRVFERPS